MKNARKEAQSRFLSDTATHEMVIHQDTEERKHLSFRNPGTSSYWFDIVTWPGVLVIRGDMGTYLFARERDMLGFFRPKEWDLRSLEPGQLHINPRYWLEKLQATDSNGENACTVRELDRKAFNKQTMDHLNYFIGADDGDCEYPREFVTELRTSLRQLVLDEVHDSTPPNDVYRILREFSFRDPEGNQHWPFGDTASIPTEYTFHVLWNLYAIAWAIQKYDAHIASVPAEH